MQERPRDWTPPKPHRTYGAKHAAGSWAIRFIAIIGAGILVAGIYQDAPQTAPPDSPTITYATTNCR